MEDRNELINAKIQECYNLVYAKTNAVYEVFKEFFGEDFVDLQGILSPAVFRDRVRNRSISVILGENCPTGDYSGYYLYDLEVPEEVLVKYLDVITEESVIQRMVNFLPSYADILIRFPEVKVTNEYNKSTVVQELYAKVNVYPSGNQHNSFTLNRAKYSKRHWESNYQHSHTNGINYSNLSEFRHPCLGSGPIRETQEYLYSNYDLTAWNLFCVELDKYVRVESLAGIPYRKLESIGFTNYSAVRSNMTNSSLYYNGYKELILAFLEDFAKTGVIKFNFSEGSYTIGMSFKEWAVVVSNAFIDWFNKEHAKKNPLCEGVTLVELVDINLLTKCIIVGETIYSYTGNSYNYEQYPINDYKGRQLFAFKGRDICLDIYDDSLETSNNHVYILNRDLLTQIAKRVITLINHQYNGTTNSISKKALYL